MRILTNKIHSTPSYEVLLLITLTLHLFMMARLLFFYSTVLCISIPYAISLYLVEIPKFILLELINYLMLLALIFNARHILLKTKMF